MRNWCRLYAPCCSVSGRSVLMAEDGGNGQRAREFPAEVSFGEWKERITIQKLSGNDKAGNHVLAWEDHFSCSAFREQSFRKEYWRRRQINAQKDMYFIIPVLFGTADMGHGALPDFVPGAVYNITFIVMCGIRIGREAAASLAKR